MIFSKTFAQAIIDAIIEDAAERPEILEDLTSIYAENYMKQATEKIRGNEWLTTAVMLEQLPEFMGGEEDPVEVLRKLNEADPREMVDVIFTPIERFEWQLNVQDLFEMIKP